ncbi:hypothetical protein DLE60_14990, partial [Micromonospora globispora]|uniref:CocE/NonD family hydrolase C-terminal non-catalytic domain-containing protein n=1 Tax=Micromonospora globispora TaxID=1450148 RepID=UPI000D8E06BD
GVGEDGDGLGRPGGEGPREGLRAGHRLGLGVVRIPVTLWPTAHRFAPGHRLRVQVSGGAHPRYARNPGTGEPLGTAVTLRAGRRAILHDPAHPSAIVLPLAGATPLPVGDSRLD